jgi:hypothetical protein
MDVPLERKHKMNVCYTCWYDARNNAVAVVSRSKKTNSLKDEVVPCRDCGKRATQYDHRDYNKPLEVEPVCQSCNLLRGHAKPMGRRLWLKLQKGKIMKTIILLASLAVPCFADEVLLKDGRRVEFKSVEDTGETYTIVTPEGSRVVVKRSEVDGFAKTEPAVALTGAAMSFGKSSKLDSVDLLKKVESDKDFLSGSWKFQPDGTLLSVSQADSPSFQVRYAPTSEEYNLTLVIERTDGDDNIGIAFPAPGGRQCQFFFDVDKGKYSAVLIPGGPEGHLKASTPITGKQFVAKKPRIVVLMIRKSALVVQVDGKDLTTLRTDWSKIVPLCGQQARDAFAVSALTSGVRISKMSVTTVQK